MISFVPLPGWARINGVLLYREGPNLWRFRVPLAFSSSNTWLQTANDRPVRSEAFPYHILFAVLFSCSLFAVCFCTRTVSILPKQKGIKSFRGADAEDNANVRFSLLAEAKLTNCFFFFTNSSVT